MFDAYLLEITIDGVKSHIVSPSYVGLTFPLNASVRVIGYMDVTVASKAAGEAALTVLE